MVDDQNFGDSPDVSAKAAIGILVCQTQPPTRRIIFEKCPDAIIAPASITKLLTALTAIKISSRFNADTSMQCVVATSDDVEGSGRNLKPGDRLTLRDSIANLLIASSNISANLVARTCGAMGDTTASHNHHDAIENFVAEMNSLAKSLAMHSSCFHNPHGLAARGQRSSARELAILIATCLDDPLLAELISRDDYEIDVRGENMRRVKVTSIFKTSTKKIVPNFSVPQFQAGKSGSLWPSYFNLAAMSQINSRQHLISVTCGSPSPTDRYLDYLKLVEFGNRRADPSKAVN